MRESGRIDLKQKGNLGEEVIIKLCLERKRKFGGLLYQSYSYPYQTERDGTPCTGNIKYRNGAFFAEDGLYTDEIDVLYVTNYRVFVIEVKSYHANLEIYDHWMKRNGQEMEKSHVAQTEKHARHLYRAIYDVLPDGNPKYIVPILVYVDRCTYNDSRSADMQYYIPVCKLDNFKKTLVERNTPGEYCLDIPSLKRKLNEVKTSIGKEL